MNRGKLLHSGLSSVQAVLSQVDTFLTWVSDMDLRLERVEQDALRSKKGKTNGQVAKAEMKKYKVCTSMYTTSLSRDDSCDDRLIS